MTRKCNWFFKSGMQRQLPITENWEKKKGCRERSIVSFFSLGRGNKCQLLKIMKKRRRTITKNWEKKDSHEERIISFTWRTNYFFFFLWMGRGSTGVVCVSRARSASHISGNEFLRGRCRRTRAGSLTRRGRERAVLFSQVGIDRALVIMPATHPRFDLNRNRGPL